MSQRSSDPELNDIESALRGLVPVPSRLDRDALMFQAGAALARSTPRGRWIWPSIAATLAIALFSESLLLVIRPDPPVIERIVVVREPAPATGMPARLDVPAPPPAPQDALSGAWSPDAPSLASSWPEVPGYQRVQDLVLRLGLDALPERSSPPESRFDRTEESVDVPVPSAGHLRRLELEKLLNLKSGGSS
jgi:hypothetical protein